MGHLNDEFQIKDPTLLQYYHLVQKVIQSAFEQVRIQHIPKSKNVRADILSKVVSTKLKSRHWSLLQQTLSALSITNTCHTLTQHQADNWTTPYIQYLQTTMIGDDLYKRGYGQPLLKCITAKQAQYIIKELHEGICGYHFGARTMTTRILRAGYFWPTMEADCHDFVKRCWWRIDPNQGWRHMLKNTKHV